MKNIVRGVVFGVVVFVGMYGVPALAVVEHNSSRSNLSQKKGGEGSGPSDADAAGSTSYSSSRSNKPSKKGGEGSGSSDADAAGATSYSSARSNDATKKESDTPDKPILPNTEQQKKHAKIQSNPNHKPLIIFMIINGFFLILK